MKKAFQLSVREIVMIALMVASIEVAKLTLSFLPNIELVSLFIVLFTLFLGPKVYYAIFTFVVIEGLLFGFGIWWFMYLYIWPLLATISLLLQKKESNLFWAITTGTFGLFFGALCSIPYFIIGGPQMALSYFISGIPFDIIHCISNFIITLILFNPLYTMLQRVKKDFLYSDDSFHSK